CARGGRRPGKLRNRRSWLLLAGGAEVRIRSQQRAELAPAVPQPRAHCRLAGSDDATDVGYRQMLYVAQQDDGPALFRQTIERARQPGQPFALLELNLGALGVDGLAERRVE